MTIIPSAPGIYVVSLSNEHPISVNADRAHAERCIFVTNANCKFGRAQNLSRRYRDYAKTFGAQHVTFEVVALVDDPAVVEAAVASRLTQHRIRGATGRPNEWLEGITVHALKQLIAEVIASQGSMAQPAQSAAPTLLPPGAKRLTRRLPAAPRPSVLSGAEASPSLIAAAATYLESVGMPVSVLRDLHHFQQRTETFASTIRYFGTKHSIGANNRAYGARLLFVEHGHRSGGTSFEALAAEALRRYPVGVDA